VRLEFDAQRASGKPTILDAASDVQEVLRSLVFSKAAFGAEGTMQ
jgi:hypothetical protein